VAATRTATSATSFGIGTLVAARGREWVVLPESEPPGFLVLQPLGAGKDETAAVFPALEQVAPASFPPPDPDDAGPAGRAGLLRTALRIGFRASAGPFRSLARLAVEPRAYQLVPLLMALRQDTVRMLIADDVGIGKTVEAALIAAELLEQGDASGLAVLCGPALAEQWQGELATKFGIHAELVLPGTIRRLERGLLQGETLFDRHKHLVVSTDFIKRSGLREMFWQGCPDLLIIDEAHTCVTDQPGGTGGRSRMLRHELVTRLAADRSRHLLLVTATPHSGKDEGFRNLLALLDPGLAGLDLEIADDRARLARHLVQRRRADIRSYLDESTPFPEDRLTTERPYTLSPAYRDLFADVLAYARERVRDTDGGPLRQRVRYWSALALLRSLASSPRAAAATLVTRAKADVADLAEADQLGRSAVMDRPDEETLESADATPAADTESEDPDAPEGAAPADRDTRETRRLRRFAARAAALEGGQDAKLDTVANVVTGLLADHLNPIVFCRFIDTAEYVAEHLGRRLGDACAIAAVTGTLPPEERQARIAELTADESRRAVLVATDCLSEGVNLQDRFQAVVHYDLAWNPTRHEQREGRVDRFGQAARVVRAVTIYGTDNGIDGIVLDVLLRKHEQIRRALGISVPVPDRSDDVIEAILEGLLLRDVPGEQLALDLDWAPRKREDLHREWDSAAASERQSRTKYAQAGIQPDEVARELADMRASLGTPLEVAGFTEEALRSLRADVTIKQNALLVVTARLPAGLRDALVPGHAEPLLFSPDLPVPPRSAHLDRTDPNVAAIARYVVDTALDPRLPGQLRPARRCGVMRTAVVQRRTTLLLARFRFRVDLPGRDAPRQVIAEDARLLAYRGRAQDAGWLTDSEARELAVAPPAGNIPPDQAADFIQRAAADLPGLASHLDQAADDLAAALRDSHIRAREAAGQRVRRQIDVRALKPADVLGVYVYLPATGGQA
jgi:superfamily II DNA or RNA helicase